MGGAVARSGGGARRRSRGRDGVLFAQGAERRTAAGGPAAIWNSQNDWQTVGTRVYDFPLPTEILGKPSVSIRLMPRNNKAAEVSVDSYDESTIENNSGYNTMDYFAVRYNK